MVDMWSTHYLYSYGFAVPFIAAFVVWTRAHQAPAPRLSPDYAFGVPVTLAGAAMLVVGRLGTVTVLEQASLVVTLTGLVLLLFGRDVVKQHWFALAYLLLMTPILSDPISHLQDPSRLVSASIATNLLDVSGVPVLRQGTEIYLPSNTLSVLLECSGVNQLMALTAMVLPAAYLWLKSNSRRVVLVTFAVIVSYLSNGLRIAIVGWLAFFGFSDGHLNGEGLSHLLQGLSVSVLGYLVIGACFSMLSRSETTSAQQRDDRPSMGATALSQTVPRRRLWLDVAMLLAMLAAGASPVLALQRNVPLTEDLSALEARIDDWTMEIGPPPSKMTQLPSIDDDLVNVGGYPSVTGKRQFTGIDDEIVRVYRNSSGDRVQLYVGYYRRQEEGKELAGEAGAALAAAASVVTVGAGSPSLGVNEVVRATGGTRRGVLFWYDINGRIVSDFRRVKSYTIWDAVTRGRSNGAVVMIAWDASDPASRNAREHALAFAQALLPILRRHLPA